ncbi:Ms4533A family Cys-rich leader peptide [Prescottella agglutinans]|uniref:Ms4533A family Cys-rich leader peptide n=1 Tax=Prescottella agglutinans TaxID=1644129 RepID=UPI003BA9906C
MDHRRPGRLEDRRRRTVQAGQRQHRRHLRQRDEVEQCRTIPQGGHALRDRCRQTVARRFRSCDSGADRASAKVCRVSLVAAHQVRHELALIAVGRLAVADIHCC